MEFWITLCQLIAKIKSNDTIILFYDEYENDYDYNYDYNNVFDWEEPVSEQMNFDEENFYQEANYNFNQTQNIL